MRALPVTAEWRERVERVVARLRAEGTTIYDRLCLRGWEQELARLNEQEDTDDNDVSEWTD